MVLELRSAAAVGCIDPHPSHAARAIRGQPRGCGADAVFGDGGSRNACGNASHCMPQTRAPSAPGGRHVAAQSDGREQLSPAFRGAAQRPATHASPSAHALAVQSSARPGGAPSTQRPATQRSPAAHCALAAHAPPVATRAAQRP